MSDAQQPLRTLFVGGPGRSGTTVVAQRLSEMEETVAFDGVELKFFSEKNGLLDLWHSLVQHYSPNRAVVAMRQFRQFTRELIDGRFSQLGLSNLSSGDQWHALFDRFTARLERNSHPELTSSEHFESAVRSLVIGLHQLACAQTGSPSNPKIFIDNTPHTILEADFLTRLIPDAAFLHVMRDPRSIAQSLRSMSWGPGSLEQCCVWIDNYCRAWVQRSSAMQADMRAIHIEDLAADPASVGDMVSNWLSIGDVGSYFAYTDSDTLNGWTSRASVDDLSLLNRRLAGWVEYFGYASDRIGLRPEGASRVLADVAEPTLAVDTVAAAT